MSGDFKAHTLSLTIACVLLMLYLTRGITELSFLLFTLYLFATLGVEPRESIMPPK